MAIASTSEYKTHANISGSTEDTAIAGWLAETAAFIEKYLGRTFTTGAVTDEVYTGSGETILQLRAWPISSVSAVKFKAADGTTTTIDSDTYRVNLRTGQIARQNFNSVRAPAWDDWTNELPTLGAPSPVWPNGFENILISYTSTTSPDLAGIKSAQFAMVDELRGTAGSDPSKQSESIDGYSYTKGQNSGPESRQKRWAALLIMYRGGSLL